MVDNGNWNSYNSMENSIEAFFKLISSEYFTNNQYTVSTIAKGNPEGTHCYCVPPDHWIEATRGYMTDMYQAAGIDVSSIFNTGSGAAVGKIADLVQWAESYVGSSQYPYWTGGMMGSNATCAAFVSSAYYYAGFGTVSGSCGITLGPVGESGNIVRNADGTINWSEIPVGAFLVIKPGDGGSDSQYGHTVLYVGNGYVIEAGSTVVQKNPIDSAFCGSAYSFWAIPQGLKDYMNSIEYKTLLNAQSVSASGKGYTTQITINGRTYNEYKQYSSDYYGVTYWGGGSFAGNACGPTSLGIIASGYGINQDPVSIANYMDNRWGYTSPEYMRITIETKLNLRCTYYQGTDSGTSINQMENIIKSALQTGRPVVVCANAGIYTNCSHYMTLLGINNNNEVYLSNPGNGTLNGWVNLQYFLQNRGCGNCVITIDS